VSGVFAKNWIVKVNKYRFCDIHTFKGFAWHLVLETLQRWVGPDFFGLGFGFILRAWAFSGLGFFGLEKFTK
jgi:hypothetical protein